MHLTEPVSYMAYEKDVTKKNFEIGGCGGSFLTRLGGSRFTQLFERTNSEMETGTLAKSDPKKALLFCNTFIDTVAWSILIPTLPGLYSHFEMTNVTIGGLTSFLSLLAFASNILQGSASDYFGRTFMLHMSTASQLLGNIMIIFAVEAASLPLFVLARSLPSLLKSGMVVSQAFLYDISSVDDISRDIGTLLACSNCAFIIGPVIGGQAYMLHPHLPFLIASLLGLINVMIVFQLGISLKTQPMPRHVSFDGTADTDDPGRNRAMTKAGSRRPSTTTPPLPSLPDIGKVGGSSGGTVVTTVAPYKSAIAAVESEQIHALLRYLHMKFAFQMANSLHESLFTQHVKAQLELSGSQIGLLLGFTGALSAFTNVFLLKRFVAACTYPEHYLWCFVCLQALGVIGWALSTSLYTLVPSVSLVTMAACLFLSVIQSIIAQSQKYTELKRRELRHQARLRRIRTYSDVFGRAAAFLQDAAGADSGAAGAEAGRRHQYAKRHRHRVIGSGSRSTACLPPRLRRELSAPLPLSPHYGDKKHFSSSTSTTATSATATSATTSRCLVVDSMKGEHEEGIEILDPFISQPLHAEFASTFPPRLSPTLTSGAARTVSFSLDEVLRGEDQHHIEMEFHASQGELSSVSTLPSIAGTTTIATNIVINNDATPNCASADDSIAVSSALGTKRGSYHHTSYAVGLDCWDSCSSDEPLPSQIPPILLHPNPRPQQRLYKTSTHDVCGIVGESMAPSAVELDTLLYKTSDSTAILTPASEAATSTIDKSPQEGVSALGNDYTDGGSFYCSENESCAEDGGDGLEHSSRSDSGSGSDGLSDSDSDSDSSDSSGDRGAFGLDRGGGGGSRYANRLLLRRSRDWSLASEDGFYCPSSLPVAVEVEDFVNFRSRSPRPAPAALRGVKYRRSSCLSSAASASSLAPPPVASPPVPSIASPTIDHSQSVGISDIPAETSVTAGSLLAPYATTEHGSSKEQPHQQQQYLEQQQARLPSNKTQLLSRRRVMSEEPSCRPSMFGPMDEAGIEAEIEFKEGEAEEGATQHSDGGGDGSYTGIAHPRPHRHVPLAFHCRGKLTSLAHAATADTGDMARPPAGKCGSARSPHSPTGASVATPVLAVAAAVSGGRSGSGNKIGEGCETTTVRPASVGPVQVRAGARSRAGVSISMTVNSSTRTSAGTGTCTGTGTGTTSFSAGAIFSLSSAADRAARIVSPLLGSICLERFGPSLGILYFCGVAFLYCLLLLLLTMPDRSKQLQEYGILLAESKRSAHGETTGGDGGGGCHGSNSASSGSLTAGVKSSVRSSHSDNAPPPPTSAVAKKLL